ncbi:hypothetical protein [Noviherbaspirillum denitrificans]|uniref:Uncharacterized protein n=1 Tax=Noviherbaspirillum denitrificans TaxID=1968433 RepID=A0A254TD14_9BURK|nr:hypothetical protein [Noviherbaspirillum denitrificans]OWW19202.1 hypothetical protein AYR66_06505 [Noviherbaspirillum denitrificans]
MSYLVFVTFDLKGAGSPDYTNAYADLEKLGLRKVQQADQGGTVVIPTTAAMGTFNGKTAADVRADVAKWVQDAFTARRFKSEIFVVVGGDWAWGSRTT